MGCGESKEAETTSAVTAVTAPVPGTGGKDTVQGGPPKKSEYVTNLEQAVADYFDAEKLQDEKARKDAFTDFQLNFVKITDHDDAGLMEAMRDPLFTLRYLKIITDSNNLSPLSVEEFKPKVEQLFGEEGWDIFQSVDECKTNLTASVFSAGILAALRNGSTGAAYSEETAVTELCTDMHTDANKATVRGFSNIIDQLHAIVMENLPEDSVDLDTIRDALRAIEVDLDNLDEAIALTAIFMQPALTQQYFQIISNPDYLSNEEFKGNVKDLFGETGWNILESKVGCVDYVKSNTKLKKSLLSAFTMDANGIGYIERTDGAVAELCTDLHEGIDATGDERFIPIMEELYAIATQNLS